MDIIYYIYKTYPEDIFLLSSGHAGLALYVVLEKIYGFDAEKLFKKHGVHPNRCLEDLIYCSSGSLGHVLPITFGMALAQPDKKFHCLLSDGETYEGSVWEALRAIQEFKVKNIEIYVNCNGFGAYKEIDIDWLDKAMNAFTKVNIIRTVFPFEFLHGIDAHYYILDGHEKTIC